MSDEAPVPGELGVGDHLAGYRLALIARFAVGQLPLGLVIVNGARASSWPTQTGTM